MYHSLINLLAIAATASAATIDIDVGENGSYKFDPESATAAIGDTLAFHFYSGSGGHSVVSSTFASPCVSDSNSFFSGYITGNDEGNEVFEVTVNSTDPIWFYCSLGKHCQNGMVGVINPPADTEIAAYKTAAKSASKAAAPDSPTGGILATLAANAGESTITSGTSASSAAAASSTEASLSSVASGASVTSSKASSSASAASSSAAAATTSSSSGAERSFGDAARILALLFVTGGFVVMLA